MPIMVLTTMLNLLATLPPVTVNLTIVRCRCDCTLLFTLFHFPIDGVVEKFSRGLENWLSRDNTGQQTTNNGHADGDQNSEDLSSCLFTCSEPVAGWHRWIQNACADQDSINCALLGSSRATRCPC